MTFTSSQLMACCVLAACSATAEFQTCPNMLLCETFGIINSLASATVEVK